MDLVDSTPFLVLKIPQKESIMIFSFQVLMLIGSLDGTTQ